MKVIVQTQCGNVEFSFSPVANFGQCALRAALASAPVFLQELMNCLSGGQAPSGDYTPGDRPRCA